MKAVFCFYNSGILFLIVSSSSSADNTSAEMDQSSNLKWALIGGAVGLAIGVSVVFCMHKKSVQNSNQNIESNCGQSESLLSTENPAERENRRTETTNGNSDLQRENTQLHDTLNAVKHELKNQKDQLDQKLQDVETKRKKNKEEVQNVEKKIRRESMQSVDLNAEAASDGEQPHETTNEVEKESENLTEHFTETGKEKTDENKQCLDSLNAVKHEDNQKDQLNQKPQDVETKRKENKEEVQIVEKKITEKKSSDYMEQLLKEKEELLQSQWKLDEEKKHYERQILNIEKALEPIEMYMMKTEK
ncbi:interaptin-like [Xiphophorus maculatus]|uniref:interaptin-like n=1 Tax=Xiphophorus maculatus TaxID=8083 RepID=UPI000C6D0F32|nr:interaptin-like [Xiphophorus maculatus]